MSKSNKKVRSLVCLLVVFATLLCSCAPAATQSTDTAAADPSQDPSAPVPDPAYSSDEYLILGKDEYLDKTQAGFLSQLVGFLSGYEFVKASGDRCYVAMPDKWFEYCNGPYAGDNPHKRMTDKYILNQSTGIHEVWFDDDFSVDVVNQYILSNMYIQKRTLCQNYITDGWLSFNVWDMGGGQRKVGAYGLINRNNYLPQFAGNTEYGNWYSYLSEPYLGTDTLGMNAPGMPETATHLASIFSQVTGDRDNLRWAQMFSTMISMAYFEKDIPALIKKSAEATFPADSWPSVVLDEVFALYEKYPDNWRTAYKEFERRHYVANNTTQTDTDINCGFVIFDLLYGGGDYMTTCKIGSLAGYDCESTCGIALTVLGVMNGTSILPEETNAMIWQEGKGVLTNLVEDGLDEGIWMIAEGLPERIQISKVIDMYRKNFEKILVERGGAMDDNFYYIPKETQTSYSSVKIENGDFETGDLSGYTKTGTVTISDLATTGFYSAKLSDNATLTTKVSGLEAGKTYSLSAYIRTTENATALLFAQSKGGADAVCASVHKTVGTPKYEAQSTVKRTLTFTATSSEMEIGVKFIGSGSEYSIVDNFILHKTQETPVGTVTIKNKAADNVYAQTLELSINSEKKTEVYLKIKFDNSNSSIVNVPITINGTKYASAALYKTCGTNGMESANHVYIPVVLKEGDNTVSLAPKGKISVYSAELVEVQNRF